MISLLSDAAVLPPLGLFTHARHDRVILRHLMDTGTWVSTQEMAEVIWGHREDGGPLNARDSVAVLVGALRKRLRPGFHIESMMGRGSFGYRLVVDETVILDRIARTLAA